MKKERCNLRLQPATMSVIRHRAESTGKTLNQVVEDAMQCAEVGGKLDQISAKLDKIEELVLANAPGAKMAASD